MQRQNLKLSDEQPQLTSQPCKPKMSFLQSSRATKCVVSLTVRVQPKLSKRGGYQIRLQQHGDKRFGYINESELKPAYPRSENCLSVKV
ncbi:unnamed protein product [Amoebophrya sp. A120]|nr:unnamed protein product [Amoebophrya sp. A120]|eukprot:GSA120T00005029001.1